MLSIRKQGLLIAVLMAVLSGCTENPQNKKQGTELYKKQEAEPYIPSIKEALKMTKGDWLHDLDMAERFVKFASDNLTPSEMTMEVMIAIDMADNRIAPSIRELHGCWPKNVEMTTANTDHACLDKAGYPRSR
jgi:hypothetical protein